MGKCDSAMYGSKDVIRWALGQSCRAANNARPLWVTQGLEHARREQCHESFTFGFPDVRDAFFDVDRINQFWAAIQEPEARTLCEMYDVDSSILVPAKYAHLARCKVVDKLLDFWKGSDQTALSDAAVSEEQEREIAHEVERERQVHRPPQMQPLPHKLDPYVQRFVTNGVMPAGCPKGSITLAFDSLKRTSASTHLEPDVPCPWLHVSGDFANTVRLYKESQNYEYLRPVRWLLTSVLRDDALIISPWEANQIIRRVETSTKVRLHIYSPRITKAMASFADLRFYTVTASLADWRPPSLLQCGLGLFAGCLYLDNFTQYQDFCAFLGIVTRFDPHCEVDVNCDGFANPSSRQALGWSLVCPFEASPLPLVKALTAMRVFGESIFKTHVGKLVSGSVLTEETF